jgi:hypothetical protein
MRNNNSVVPPNPPLTRAALVLAFAAALTVPTLTTALVGYGIVRDDLNVNFYVGLNAQQHQLAVPDPTNPVQGLGVGVMFRTDVWYNPTPITLLELAQPQSQRFRFHQGWPLSGAAGFRLWF